MTPNPAAIRPDSSTRLRPCRPSAFDLAAIQTTAKLVQLLRKPAFVVFTAGSPNALRPSSREGRKQIASFFFPDMLLAIHLLARRQDRSLQSLMAEAFNDALRKYGESPIGD